LQELSVWEKAIRRGYLQGYKKYAMFPEAYVWMIEQMKNRLPNYKGEYPVWLWVKKPDMRSSGHFAGNTKCVRLTLELNREDILKSDFDDWHSVLNNSICATNEQEYDDFYAGKLSKTKEETWERIFDIERERDPMWDGVQPRRLQAVTGPVPLSKVVRVEHFVSRKQPKWLTE